MDNPVASRVGQRARTQILNRIYYDVKNPASFSSPHALYKAAVQLDRRISQKDVEDWLATQPVYVRHKQTRTRFKRRKVLSRGPFYQFQADLMFMLPFAKYNDGMKYLLVVIDCFTRYLSVVPMKTKTAVDTLKALKKAFKEMGGNPIKFQTDGGTEFFNELVQKFLRGINAVQFTTQQHDIKAQIAERVIRTLRAKIHKIMMAKKTLRYISWLPLIVDSYNHRKHSAFKGKFAPCEINKSNQKEVYDLQYGKYLAEIKAKFKFEIGDIVLVAVDKRSHVLKKMTQTFKEDLYQVIDRIADNPPTYKLKFLSNGTLVKGKFYAEQLQKVSSDLKLK